MDSIRQDIDAAQQKLISANHKIGGLGRDLEIYKESHQNQLDAFCRLQDLILGKGSTAETYDDLLAPVQELINTNFQQAKEIEDLKKGIERLKQRPENLPFSNIVQAFKDLKKEHQDLKDHVQFEKDNALRAIREVLGAKNKTDDRPHETAINAAKRVMEELKQEKENEQKLHRKNIALTDSYGRLADAVGWTPHDSVDVVVASAKALREQKLGARTYIPPKGHTIVDTEVFTKLIQDSNDLKVIKERLGI
jgi:hypothetical protein